MEIDDTTIAADASNFVAASVHSQAPGVCADVEIAELPPDIIQIMAEAASFVLPGLDKEVADSGVGSLRASFGRLSADYDSRAARSPPHLEDAGLQHVQEPPPPSMAISFGIDLDKKKDTDTDHDDKDTKKDSSAEKDADTDSFALSKGRPSFSLAPVSRRGMNGTSAKSLRPHGKGRRRGGSTHAVSTPLPRDSAGRRRPT